MGKITSAKELRETILSLEAKQIDDARLLKEEFKATCENLKPINLIKNKFNDIVSSPNLKEDLLSSVMGLVAGYLSKKVTVGSTRNPLKQLLGTLLQVGVTSLVSKNSEGIKSVAGSLINSFLRKREKFA